MHFPRPIDSTLHGVTDYTVGTTLMTVFPKLAGIEGTESANQVRASPRQGTSRRCATYQVHQPQGKWSSSDARYVIWPPLTSGAELSGFTPGSRSGIPVLTWPARRSPLSSRMSAAEMRYSSAMLCSVSPGPTTWTTPPVGGALASTSLSGPGWAWTWASSAAMAASLGPGVGGGSD